MSALPFALYDAFTASAFGGSQAAIVSNAAGLDPEIMQQIAKEIGQPATSFVMASKGNSISARFFSTITELPMCGHGTICLMTRMLEQGVLKWNGGPKIEVELCLVNGAATVEVLRQHDGRAAVMLDIKPPAFARSTLDPDELAQLLGISASDFNAHLPLEIASGDFIHLVVPVNDLTAMQRITPDFARLKHFCIKQGIETVAAFCSQVENPGNTVHVRDFCPAVGVAESAGAGTTNAALTSYLIRHGIVGADNKGQIVVSAEQGHEIQRPGSISSVVAMNGKAIQRLQVGGVATKIIDGELQLPL